MWKALHWPLRHIVHVQCLTTFTKVKVKCNTFFGVKLIFNRNIIKRLFYCNLCNTEVDFFLI